MRKKIRGDLDDKNAALPRRLPLLPVTYESSPLCTSTYRLNENIFPKVDPQNLKISVARRVLYVAVASMTKHS
jgi:hypothetical protein